jgi:hypothetical protein
VEKAKTCDVFPLDPRFSRLRLEGNNTPFFFIPVCLVGAFMYFVLPVDFFVAQMVACAASFYEHVFFDKEYHVERSRLQRFAWFQTQTGTALRPPPAC